MIMSGDKERQDAPVNDEFHYAIEGELTIFVVQALTDEIMPLLTEHDEIEIDLSRVTEIDAAGMQLMISIKMESILLDKRVRYSGHSRQILEMIDLCDLGGFFGDQLVMPSGKREGAR